MSLHGFWSKEGLVGFNKEEAPRQWEVVRVLNSFDALEPSLRSIVDANDARLSLLEEDVGVADPALPPPSGTSNSFFA